MFSLKTINQVMVRSGAPLRYAAIAVALMNVAPAAIAAEEGHNHTSQPQQEASLEAKGKAGALLKAVRQATERFKDVAVAEKEGYQLQFGCVTDSNSGA